MRLAILGFRTLVTTELGSGRVAKIDPLSRGPKQRRLS